jgi:hypothetical protein
MQYHVGDRVEFWSLRSDDTGEPGTGVQGAVEFCFADGSLVVKTDAVGQLICGPTTHRIQLANAIQGATAQN